MDSLWELIVDWAESLNTETPSGGAAERHALELRLAGLRGYVEGVASTNPVALERIRELFEGDQ